MIKSILTSIFILVVSVSFGQKTAELDKMKFLIGKWEFDAKSRLPDSTFQSQVFYSNVEYIFSKNALKDDFCFKNAEGELVIYGSTIRSFDTKTGKWKMLWYNYNLSFITQMEGVFDDGKFHFTGKGIDEKGEYIERITFFDISEDRYSWKSDKSYDKGETWLKNYFSYTAKRISG